MIIGKLLHPYNTKVYLDILQNKLKHEVDIYQNVLKNIIDRYGLEAIYKAIDTIYISGISIYCPTNGLNGQIIRALEYGTNNTIACHIISKVNNKLLKEVNNELII